MRFRPPRYTLRGCRSGTARFTDACSSGVFRTADSSTQSSAGSGRSDTRWPSARLFFHISLNSLGTAGKGQTGPQDPAGNSKSLADRQKRIRVPALDSPPQRQFFRRSANVGTTSASAAPLRENHWQCSPAFHPTKPHHHSNKLAAKARRAVS